jgi:hypothetical protein
MPASDREQSKSDSGLRDISKIVREIPQTAISEIVGANPEIVQKAVT